MITPCILTSFFLLATQSNNTSRAPNAMKVSIRNLGSNTTGIIKAVVPTTNKILKILLPTIFPIAISAFPFMAAETEVTSSGRDVPSATIVRPINLSLNPKPFAKAVAASTVISEPHTTATRPTKTASNSFHMGSF